MTMATRKSQRGGKLKKPAAPPKPANIPVRIPIDLIDRIDAIKPKMVPREPFVRALLEDIVTEIEQAE